MCSAAVFHDFGFPVFPTCGIGSGCMGQDAEACEHVARPLFHCSTVFSTVRLGDESDTVCCSNVKWGGNANEFMKPVGELLCGLFYKKPGGATPWAFHLWYLRDLIMIVACSPVLFYMKRYVRSEVTCLLFLGLSLVGITAVQFLSFFWFMAGDAFLGRMDKIRSWAWLVVYAGICTLEMLWPQAWMGAMDVPFTAVGILAIWSIYDFATSGKFSLKEYRWLATACSFTFFIYLFHEPTLNIVRKLLIIPLGRSSAGFAINYLVSPWIFAALSVSVGLLFRKYLPRIYSVCVGGR